MESTLFGEFCYGMKKEKVIELSQAQACPNMPGQTLCASQLVHYIGGNWQECFYFNNRNELAQVSLLLPQAQNPGVNQLCRKLNESGWQISFLESDSAAFDAWAALKRHAREQADQEIEEFIKKGASSEELVIRFLPIVFAHDSSQKTYEKALAKAPDDLVEASLSLNDSNLRLAFTCPILARKYALSYGQMIKR